MIVSTKHHKLQDEAVRFHLNEELIKKYKDKKPDFGYNGLGEFVYMKNYSRLIKQEDGTKRKEIWYETIKRVVEGTYTIQKSHIFNNNLYWNEEKAQISASIMFGYMFDMKFLPAGRGLWAMGTNIIYKKGLFEALQSCAFVSTEKIDKNIDEFTKPFRFMADMSMLGAGVGFDVKGAGKVIIHKPNKEMSILFKVPDSREGWVKAFELIINSYHKNSNQHIIFDYTGIREKGVPLKTYGGYSSGYEPLMIAIERIRKILDGNNQQPITESSITDIMNIIGDCVVSGGIRRTAQIAFGKSEEFINLKNFEKNSYRGEWMHRSNNAVDAEIGQNYNPYIPLISSNGEPGFYWNYNAKKFGRMGRYIQERYDADIKAIGGNPCLEQTLESFEMCCLVETFPNKADNFEEFREVLRYAYLYAKTVTLGKTSWTETNQVMLRNRRIGTSVSGIQQFIAKRGIPELKRWLEGGYESLLIYDIAFSDWLTIPRSIKLSSVKPSGTVSLLTGATAGIHYPIAESRYYIRRVEVNEKNPMYKYAQSKGFEIEPKLVKNPEGKWIPLDGNYVIKFYIDDGVEPHIPSMWHQLEMTAFMQEVWADNQVSVTVKFDPETEGKELARALDFYQYRIKGVSFLPRIDLTDEYPQLPYEAISEETFNKKLGFKNKKSFIDINKDITWTQPEGEKGCNTDYCEIQ